MKLKNEIELVNTRKKLRELEEQYETCRGRYAGNPTVRELTLASLKRIINQLKEEIAEAGEEGDGVPSKQKRIIECIRRLRKLDLIAGMEDPVAWQRCIREDRDPCHGK